MAQTGEQRRAEGADLSKPEAFRNRTEYGRMPKQKTHKGMKRRFKITASGKARHRSAFRGHLLSGKSAKRKRNLRNGGVADGKDAKNIVEALRPSL